MDIVTMTQGMNKDYDSFEVVEEWKREFIQTETHKTTTTANTASMRPPLLDVQAEAGLHPLPGDNVLHLGTDVASSLRALTIPCPACSTKLGSIGSLRKHVTLKHNADPSNATLRHLKTSLGYLNCGICHRDVTPLLDSLKSHLSTFHMVSASNKNVSEFLQRYGGEVRGKVRFDLRLLLTLRERDSTSSTTTTATTLTLATTWTTPTLATTASTIPTLPTTPTSLTAAGTLTTPSVASLIQTADDGRSEECAVQISEFDSSVQTVLRAPSPSWHVPLSPDTPEDMLILANKNPNPTSIMQSSSKHNNRNNQARILTNGDKHKAAQEQKPVDFLEEFMLVPIQDRLVPDVEVERNLTTTTCQCYDHFCLRCCPSGEMVFPSRFDLLSHLARQHPKEVQAGKVDSLAGRKRRSDTVGKCKACLKMSNQQNERRHTSTLRQYRRQKSLPLPDNV